MLRKALEILVSFTVQIFLFSDLPNAFTVTGAVIITSCVIASGARSMVDKRSKNKTVRKVLCLRGIDETDQEEPSCKGR
jgi:hypothetical protein